MTFPTDPVMALSGPRAVRKSAEKVEVDVWQALDGTWSYRVFVFIPGEGNSIVLRGHDRPTKRAAIDDAAVAASPHRIEPRCADCGDRLTGSDVGHDRCQGCAEAQHA